MSKQKSIVIASETAGHIIIILDCTNTSKSSLETNIEYIQLFLLTKNSCSCLHILFCINVFIVRNRYKRQKCTNYNFLGHLLFVQTSEIQTSFFLKSMIDSIHTHLCFYFQLKCLHNPTQSQDILSLKHSQSKGIPSNWTNVIQLKINCRLFHFNMFYFPRRKRWILVNQCSSSSIP